jgi:hypothetical protein
VRLTLLVVVATLALGAQARAQVPPQTPAQVPGRPDIGQPSTDTGAQPSPLPPLPPPEASPDGGVTPPATPPPGPPLGTPPIAPAETPAVSPSPPPVPPSEQLEKGDKPEVTVESDRRGALADDDESEAHEIAPRPNAKGDPFGDELELGPKFHGFQFRLLLQTRYTYQFNDPMPIKDNGFALERAFLRGSAHPYKWLSAKLLVDFAEFAYANPVQALKQVYGEIRPYKRLEFTVGLFKRLYGLVELLPVAEYEFADTGVIDNLIKTVQFGGRDVGVMSRVDPLPKRKWLHVYLAAYGGAGEGADGVAGTTGTTHNGPDFAAPSLLLEGRLESRPIKHVALGATGCWRPQSAVDADTVPYAQVTTGTATAVDATYSNRWLVLRGEWLWGDRTDINTRGNALSYMGAWGMVAARFALDEIVVMPAFRLEWLNDDLQHPEGDRYIFTGALNVDVARQLRFLFDYSYYLMRPGGYPIQSVPGIFNKSFDAFIVQVQVKI